MWASAALTCTHLLRLQTSKGNQIFSNVFSFFSFGAYLPCGATGPGFNLKRYQVQRALWDFTEIIPLCHVHKGNPAVCHSADSSQRRGERGKRKIGDRQSVWADGCVGGVYEGGGSSPEGKSNAGSGEQRRQRWITSAKSNSLWEGQRESVHQIQMQLKRNAPKKKGEFGSLWSLLILTQRRKCKERTETWKALCHYARHCAKNNNFIRYH